MFEDSYLDSFMEGHIGNWTGDEDRYYDDHDDHDDHDDSPCDHWDDPDGENIIGGFEPEDDPYASEWREDDYSCDHY